MQIQEAKHQADWDNYLVAQQFSPFLQSWTMGEVYRETGQEPIRIEIRDGDTITGICQAIVVSARRGRHLAISYGPLLTNQENLLPLLDYLQSIAQEAGCIFVRMSPFWEADCALATALQAHATPSPLHLLAEHIWYIPLMETNIWTNKTHEKVQRDEKEIFMKLRKTTRNLVRRAEREGVTVRASSSPMEDLHHFLTLHEETRKRHNFTPYSDVFFRAQVRHFSERNECTLYLAEYNNEIVATSVHMHIGGETSYHHGASTHKYAKIPASYLLQWTAITDALTRGDSVYNFWGIAPEGAKKHPFQGVRTFKTGFSGELRTIMHSQDIPLSSKYYLTKGFEIFRKWKRGF